MTKQMTGAEMVIEALADQGVEHIFGYPGGAVLPIYDALFQQERGRSTSWCATSRARAMPPRAMRARPARSACVLVTSGPGATNAVTALTDALMDSIPLVCITGQVPTHLIGNDAFQECDTVGITRPCTKHNCLVQDVNDLPRVLHEAFYVATHRPARPGGRRHPEGRPVRHGHLYRRRRTSSTRPTSRRLKGDVEQDQGGGRADAPAPSARCSIPAAASSIPAPRRASCCANWCS